MGMQIAKRLHNNGFDVLAWNRSEGPRKDFENFVHSTGSGSSSGKAFAEIPTLIEQMSENPRVFWLMLPHETVSDFLKDHLNQFLKPGDIVIDGGNSFYKDSIARAELYKASGIYFYDCGTSGGVWGFANGFGLMIGGDKQQWPKIEPIFKTLSSGESYGLVGNSGAGHFVKMVHNGIEYGMMEAIAEGFGVLEASHFNLDLKQVSNIYRQKGTVISSWLMDLTSIVFEKEDIASTKGEIAATGEGEWTINAAKELGIDVRVIEDSLRVRKESNDPKTWQKFSNKLVALLRKQFGGHGVESNK